MAKAMSEHAVFEMYSGYIYLQASLAMEKENYKGYSKWLFDHYKEEFTHAEDFIAFLQKRDITPQLSDIKYEAVNLKTPLEVAKLILEHEQKVTARISALLKQARELGDYASEVFLHSYINEQIEEEDIAKNNDKYVEARRDIRNIVHRHKDGNSCNRVNEKILEVLKER